MEQAAEGGLNAEHVEVVPADLESPRAQRIAAGVERCRRDAERGQTLEAAALIAHVEVVRIRPESAVTLVDAVKAALLGQIERAKHERVQDAEHDRVRADAERERDDGDRGETRRLAQDAE